MLYLFIVFYIFASFKIGHKAEYKKGYREGYKRCKEEKEIEIQKLNEEIKLNESKYTSNGKPIAFSDDWYKGRKINEF